MHPTDSNPPQGKNEEVERTTYRMISAKLPDGTVKRYRISLTKEDLALIMAQK